MVTCSKCGHENSDDAKFCASCGKSLAVKKVNPKPAPNPSAKKLNLSPMTIFSIAAPLVLIFLAFVSRFIFLITTAQGFFEYMGWLFETLVFVLLGGVMIFAQMKNKPGVVNLMRLGLTAHGLLSYTFMVVVGFFVTVSRMFHIMTIVLMLFMLATLVLEQFGHKLAKTFNMIVGFATPAVFFVNGFVSFLYIFFFGFRNFPITFFFTLMIFFTLSAYTFILLVPVLGNIALLLKKKPVPAPTPEEVVGETRVEPVKVDGTDVVDTPPQSEEAPK